MEKKQIELTQPVNPEEKVVETTQHQVQPAPISALFLRYSSVSERFILFLGFLCTCLALYSQLVAIAAGILFPVSYIYYGDLLNTLIRENLDWAVVGKVVLMVAILMSLSSLCILLERYCLSSFAGRHSSPFFNQNALLSASVKSTPSR